MSTEKVDGLPQVQGEDVFSAATNAAFAKRRRRRSDDGQETPQAAAVAATPAEPAVAPAEPAGDSVPEPRAEDPHSTPDEPPAAAKRPNEEQATTAAAPPQVESAPPSSPAQPAVPATTIMVRSQAETSRAEDGPVVVELPTSGSDGGILTQCTINVSSSVRDRVAHYQLTKKMETGREPTNAVVVRRAVIAARKSDAFARLVQQVIARAQEPADDEDFDPDGFLGEAIGRRAERGRIKDSQQQSFRPSRHELATYDAISNAYGFPSRSEFLNEVLDDFLPAVTGTHRVGRRR